MTRPAGDPTEPAAEPVGVEVWAAGAVVWRRGPGGIEVLVVHRPRYDDWSLPKGKREPGESDEECALREVREETGLVGSLGTELATIGYRDRKGRTKQVRYWAIAAVGTFVANDEVDDARWVAVTDAASALTYAHDAGVVDRLTRAVS